MSLSKSIPKKLQAEMEKDSFYQACCVTGKPRGIKAKIEWHHNFETYQYGNKGRLNEKWCILPVIKQLHDKANVREVRNILNWIMLNRADDETLKKYSKCLNLVYERERLNKIYNGVKGREIINEVVEKYV